MRQALRIGLILLIVVLLLQSVIINPLFNLIFLGMIPGTSITLPFWVMGLFYLFVIYACVKYISKQQLYIGDPVTQGKTARRIARAKVTKKKQPRTNAPLIDQLITFWHNTLSPKLKLLEQKTISANITKALQSFQIRR